MKIIKKETKTVESPSIRIEYYFENKNNELNIQLRWTCPKCSGYGCGRHGSRDICDDYQKISSLKELRESFGDSAADDFKNRILNFLNIDE